MGKTGEPRSLNRGQFHRLAAGGVSFGRLEAEIGPERADEVVRLLYEREARKSDPAGRYVQVADGDLGRYSARLDAALAAECAQIASARAHVTALLGAAERGALRPGLGDAAPRSEAADWLGGADIGRAAEWICRTLHGDRTEAVRAILAEHVAAMAGGALGRTPELLDRIHARLFPEAPAQRSPNPAVAYPSSVGGRHLLETVFRWTAAAVWPPRGDAGWLDVALFYLGAVGTAQGYADGNKRMARIAYALTLLRGGRRFVAPGPDLELTLIRMTAATAPQV